MNAGESVHDVAVYTSLLVTCSGGMDYLATILPQAPSSTQPVATTPTPVSTVVSTSSSPVATGPQATVTVIDSGETRVYANTVIALVVVVMVALLGLV